MDISLLCLNFHAHQAASYIAWISFCERKITYPKYSSAFHSLLPLFLDTMLKGFVCFNIELLYLQTFYNQFEKSRENICKWENYWTLLCSNILHYYQNENF